MLRITEPELMDDDLQVEAYALADFEGPHRQFIQRLQVFINEPGFDGTALELGCGPGDISRRFAVAYPQAKIDAIDGSVAMVMKAKMMLTGSLKARVNLVLGVLPDAMLPQNHYKVIFSNSLLHHLHEPQVLWQVIKKYSQPGTRVVIMDLFRPESVADAKRMVATYAAGEPEILQNDFYNSLLAAFTLDEIKAQLKLAGLRLAVEQISDRHVFISGVMA